MKGRVAQELQQQARTLSLGLRSMRLIEQLNRKKNPNPTDKRLSKPLAGLVLAKTINTILSAVYTNGTEPM